LSDWIISERPVEPQPNGRLVWRYSARLRRTVEFRSFGLSSEVAVVDAVRAIQRAPEYARDPINNWPEDWLATVEKERPGRLDGDEINALALLKVSSLLRFGFSDLPNDYQQIAEDIYQRYPSLDSGSLSAEFEATVDIWERGETWGFGATDDVPLAPGISDSTGFVTGHGNFEWDVDYFIRCLLLIDIEREFWKLAPMVS